MSKRIVAILLLIYSFTVMSVAQNMTVAGRVTDEGSKQPIEFASVLMKDNGRWAVTDADGRFIMKNVPEGKAMLVVQCLGYATRSLVLDIKRDMKSLNIRLKQEDLRLEEVTITARRKHDEATTSYTIDRAALDQQQLLNLGDIETLLPGGKTVNPTLMNDDRLALRSGSLEKGNASFGTAIEIDGARLDNNAAAGETMSASTRSLGTSNIESVEIVTGIPSVEYGDLSNGVVKVNTRKGKSPFIIEGKLNQHTRQIAVNKGFDLGASKGVLNASFEHARSFSDAASPHTAYQRNILSLNYRNTFWRQWAPLTLNIGISGNIGGYNSESDPDNDLEDYAKVRDNALRTHVQLDWLLNKPWITNLQLHGSLSMSDRKSENYSHASSASTQPYIHTMTEGYAMAQEYDVNPNADIVLGPTGYWYVRSYHDSKPLNWSLKLKGDWTRRFGPVLNKLLAGVEYTGSKNNGRGNYFEDMRYATTWREYRYDALPAMNNVAIYAEEKVTIPTSRLAQLEITAGLRDDITLISGSDYGTVSSLSPRFNSRYLFWRNQRKQWVSDLSIHAGWGKSVKLPSFQVLYPAPSYADRLAFASTSTSDNKSFYAYHTYPSKSLYNADLRWQYTNQADLGLEMTVKGTRINVSAYYHRTCRSYMSTDIYTPMTYLYTPPSSLDGIGIAVANRQFDINRQTGVVTVSDATGVLPGQALAYNQRNTYAVNSRYVNASPVSRYGLEWMVDFVQIRALRTSLRLDGNYYYYKGLDDVLFADVPLGVNTTQASGQPYSYVGYYRGSNVTSAGSVANASISNGGLSKQVNLNATVTTHIPSLRLIVSLRVETSLYNYRRQLSEYEDGTRGYALASNADYFGTPYDGSSENKFLAVYPEYYSTWDNPTELIPFAERFAWARDNDPALYSDLSKLVVRSNYAYSMNPNRISSYYSANLSVTKEIGNHVSLSFYANNFLNNMRTVHSSQTDLETSLFGSSYIPSYYYGLSLRLKF
ncbi:MAG: TonB-dependent receptor [Prevotella sp.]|nr:TonB-dependent receptor [Prevotella sp.]